MGIFFRGDGVDGNNLDIVEMAGGLGCGSNVGSKLEIVVHSRFQGSRNRRMANKCARYRGDYAIMAIDPLLVGRFAGICHESES